MSNELPLIARARAHGDAPAVVGPGRSWSYGELIDASSRVAGTLLQGTSGDAVGPGLPGERVAYLVEPGFEHVAVQWGIWRAGGIGVPLSPHHPAPEIAYFLENAGVSKVIADPAFAGRIDEAARSLLITRLDTSAAQGASTSRLDTSPALAGMAAPMPPSHEDAGALILYTSGTTSRPKGVLLTHANLRAQVESLIEAWEWTSRDRILCFLPLHHVHGIVNVMTCALWAGAQCEFLPAFDAEPVWRRIAEGKQTVLMAVPTIYHRLIRAWRATGPRDRRDWSAAAERMRLMVSGSAALPVRTLEEWREVSGHTLLERYGMTEIGMALSNPLRGERRPGFVGAPLPGVDLRLVGEAGGPVAPGDPGEIEVQGPGVFREYWNNPEATAAAFRDGWFRTGDLAVLEQGRYRILGRTSVDIIKTGGYKVSALEIENALLEHPAIRECAVVGVADPEWGERVAAVVVGDVPDVASVVAGDAPDVAAVREWAKTRLADYKVPREILVVDALPRNAMGKVVKPGLRRLFKNAGA